MSAVIEIEFERECFKCYGTAAWMPDESCDACGSTGRVATDLGEKLLEFLEHQGIRPVLATIEQEGEQR